jgi:hypothetical protein
VTQGKRGSVNSSELNERTKKEAKKQTKKPTDNQLQIIRHRIPHIQAPVRGWLVGDRQQLDHLFINLLTDITTAPRTSL